MKKELNIKQEIIKFIDSDNDSFMDFWLNLYPADPDQIIKNSELKKPDLSFDQKYLPNGVHEDVYEIDIEKFSYSLLKQEFISPEMDQIQSIIDSLYTELQDELKLFKLKRLRISLFLCVGTVFFKFYNINVYYNILKQMREYMRQLVNHLESYTILSIGYDSVITKEKPIESNITKILFPLHFKLTKYESLIKFMNLIFVKPQGFGSHKEKKLTSTNTDDVKRKIIGYLINKDFDGSVRYINETDIDQRLKNSYTKEVYSLWQQNKNK